MKQSVRDNRRAAVTKHHGGFKNASDDEIDRLWATLTVEKRKEYLAAVKKSKTK